MWPAALLLALTMSIAPAIVARANPRVDTAPPTAGDERGLRELQDLRERAAGGDARALLGLYDAYRATPRGGRGPRVSSAALLSRAEAERSLRAAAALGEPQAVFELGAALLRGGPLRRDPAAARTWLERAVAVVPAALRPVASRLLGEALLVSDGAAAADRARGRELLDAAIDAGFPEAIRIEAQAIAEGRPADMEAARRLLEEAAASGNAAARAPLGDRLVRGGGGPAEPARGLALLESAVIDGDPLAAALLARHYREGREIGPDPRKAARLMAPYAETDLATRQALASLLAVYPVDLPDAPRLFLRLQEDEDAGEPGAAWTLLRLLQARREGFRDDALAASVIERNWKRDDRIALAHAEALARIPDRGSGVLARRARAIVDRLADRGLAAAWTLKGRLLRRGVAYARDDAAATTAFAEGAARGDPEAMIGLAGAYHQGLGVAESDALHLRWLRAAAALGWIDARRRLVHRFFLDSDRRMTLREGLTEAVALYGDGVGGVDPAEIAALFAAPRLRDVRLSDAADAVMDGLRAAPAGLEDDRLVPLLRSVPIDARRSIEARLRADGFYGGDPQGLARPEARAALAAWVDAAGPLPPYAPPAEAAPGAGPALPEIPPSVIEKAIDVAFADAARAGSDAERAAAVGKIAALARLGAPAPRWALLRNYHRSSLVRDAVTAEEVTRFALDLLLAKDPHMDRVEIDFAFATTRIAQDREGQAFADGFLATLRDDERLRDAEALDSMLRRLLFAPAACDMLLPGARARGVTGLPATGDCAVRATRDALLAHAESAGPVGIETSARAAAVPEAYAIAGVPYR